eukprot:10285720-Lingulodinium_polyedra.AAC.1
MNVSNKRYIDDGVFIASRTWSVAALAATLSSWHTTIVVKAGDVACGDEMHVLDVQLSLVERRRIQLD